MEPFIKKILGTYESELLKRRRPEQVKFMLAKNKGLNQYAEKLYGNLVKWKLDYRIEDYIKAQFFALNYMPYLPTMIHIASDAGFARWEKVKDWFKLKEGSTAKKKRDVKLHKRKINEKLYLEIISTRKYEEDDKKLFHNKISGFMLCLEQTTLFNRKSKHCLLCNYKSQCKIILKQRCLPLHKIRMNLISENTYIKNLKEKEYNIL
jgi:hypothetical protein